MKEAPKRRHRAKSPSACSVSGCGRDVDAYGFCSKHRGRWERNGTPALRPKPTVRERLIGGAERDPSGCWLWVRAVSSSGYGSISVDGRIRNAHKVAYEEFVGSVPDGKVLDHLCRVTRCINPEHLQAVTQSTNVRRGNRARGTSRI